ncbi:hypothetical protein BKA65DRAFT_540547 [Rhexocercosporidium sp. MPI-PUGE-AT-0058]|nr:hypothetical protein BKA65DRAFT_540547 [Rhexocercosporidium sp. MPI-PUGE-AT-0058]
MPHQAPPQNCGPNPTNQQTECLFTRLPIELRRIVFRYVMDDWGWTERLHIVRDYEKGDFGNRRFDSPNAPARTRRLTYVPCTATSESNQALSMTKSWPTQHDSCRGWKAFNESPPRFQGLYLAMGLTCRRLHSEAIDLLYSQHSFDLLDIPTAHRFLTHAPLLHLNQIRTLWISAVFSAQLGVGVGIPASTYLVSPEIAKETAEKWAAICEILTKMKGLQNLTMRIYRHADCGSEEIEILMPLRGVYVEREVVVQLHSAGKNRDWDEFELGRGSSNGNMG